MNKVRVITTIMSLTAITMSVASLIISERNRAYREETRAMREVSPKDENAQREREYAWSTCMKIMLEGGYSWPASEDTCKVLLEEDKQ